MRQILLYIIIVIILFSGFQEVRRIWEDSDHSLDGTYEEVKDGLSGFIEKATDTGKNLKESLNQRLQSATEKYDDIKSEIEDITSKVNEKKDQLDQTLKEIEEAKKALDELLEREQELQVETDAEVPAES